MESSDNRWLILGGVGYIGRNLVKYLLDNNISPHIVVADKAIPEISKFHPIYDAAFADPRVERIQVDLSRNPAKAFAQPYSVIVNLTGENRPTAAEDAYERNILSVVRECTPFAQSAKWVEVSTGQVYKSDKKPAKENTKLEPWTKQAEYRLRAERIVSTINSVILRVPMVYGNTDLDSLSNFYIARLITISKVHAYQGKKMKLLWSDDLRSHSVHVLDLCRAIHHAVSLNGVYNVVDEAGTTQGSVCSLMSEIFGIKHSFYGRMMSKMVPLSWVVDEVNGKFAGTWDEICENYGIEKDLTPLFNEDRFKGSHLALDGKAFKDTGFRYEYPTVTKEEVLKQITMLQELRIFPPISS